MNKEQREDIFFKWASCEPDKREQIITEYFMHGGAYSQEDWLEFLKDKLNIESSWKSVGLM